MVDTVNKAEKKCKKGLHQFTGKSCLECKKAYAKARYKNNPEKVKAANKAWRDANPERTKETQKKWVKENAERVKRNHDSWVAGNLEKARAKSKAWKARNPEKVIAYSRSWYEKNADRSKNSNKEWHKRHPGSLKLRAHIRRAREFGIGGKLSKDIEARLFRLQRGKCPCCRKPLGKSYHIDHITPISKGGKNSDSNVQLLRATCNLQKYNKNPVDFMRAKGFLI